MGWTYETETHLHEAALSAVFDDGEESLASTAVDGVSYEIVEFGERRGEDRLRPSAEIVGWRLGCYCQRWNSSETATWTDPVRWVRVPSASLENLVRHRVFAPDDGYSPDEAVERPEVEEAARAVWRREHLDLFDVDDEIRAAVAARRVADERLDAAVSKARRLGRSWAKIGAAAGMTPQSANERWRGRA